MTPGQPNTKPNKTEPSSKMKSFTDNTSVVQQKSGIFYPVHASNICRHISQSLECIQTRRTRNTIITPPLIGTSQMAMGPEDALQMDKVPFDVTSGAITQSSLRWMCFPGTLMHTYNVVGIDTKTVARVLINIISRHCYLPTTKITDEGSHFISEATEQTTKTLGIQLEHATTKHVQTIGILERTHASLKDNLKIMTGERRSMCLWPCSTKTPHIIHPLDVSPAEFH